MTTDYSTVFWFLVFTALLSTVGIIAAAKALGTLVSSDFFIQKMKEAKDKKGLQAILLILLSSLPGALLAQGDPAESASLFDISYSEVVLMACVNILLLAILFLMKRIISQLVDQISPERAVKVKKKKLSKKLSRALTGMVDITEEKNILLDHDYDGIQELDNDLPPWWKYGFYLSIAVAFIYLIHYHGIGTGDLQHEEYRKEIAQAKADIAAYLSASALNVDEHTATMMTDPKDLKTGKGIFLKNCAVCHMEDGGGQVGPNMTDDYWLYGPDMKNIYTTIKYGANNGMTSWKEKLTPIQIQQVASYIRTLHGTVPAKPKDPQGTLMPFEDSENESAPADSTDTPSSQTAMLDHNGNDM